MKKHLKKTILITIIIALAGAFLLRSILSPDSLKSTPERDIATSDSLSKKLITADTEATSHPAASTPASIQSSAPISKTVPDIAYILNNNSTTVSLCKINAATGTFTSCSSSGSNFNAPAGISINSAGTTLYITNTGSNTVSICSIDSTSGKLSNCHLSPATFNAPSGIVLNHRETFAYTTNEQSKSLSLCLLNQANGDLMQCQIIAAG